MSADIEDSSEILMIDIIETTMSPQKHSLELFSGNLKLKSEIAQLNEIIQQYKFKDNTYVKTPGFTLVCDKNGVYSEVKLEVEVATEKHDA